MQKRLYKQLSIAAAVASLASAFLPLPPLVGKIASLICFAEWWIITLSGK